MQMEWRTRSAAQADGGVPADGDAPSSGKWESSTGRRKRARLLSPWASAFFSPEMLGEAEEQMRWQGYQTFRKGQMFLLLVHPRIGQRDGGEHSCGDDPEVAADHGGGAGGKFPDVRINLTGEPVLDYDEMLQSQSDATKATVLTVHSHLRSVHGEFPRSAADRCWQWVCMMMWCWRSAWDTRR